VTFIDTNYFIRCLRDDIPEQTAVAESLLFDVASGVEEAFTSVIVLFEIYWVLSSFYQYDKTKISQTLNLILSMDFIELPERVRLDAALKMFGQTNLDLEDCYNLVYAREQKSTDFATFDKKLLRHYQN
jgi:predicted nucleic acid-binding protein